MSRSHILAALCLANVIVMGAESTSTKSALASDLFPDKIVAKGKGFEIKSSEVEEGYMAFKANRAAAGQPVSDAGKDEVQNQILDKLIATKLFLAKATERDRTNGKEIADKFINEVRGRATSEAAFRRQLIAEGTTYEDFQSQVTEQAVVKAVIDRELRDKLVIPMDQIKKFFDENQDRFQQPELVRVAHILLSTKDLNTGEDLPAANAIEKEAAAKKVLAQAKNGENFTKLVKEFSEDRNSKAKDGEYTIARGQMPPEFEAAAWTLQTNQVSDIVRTKYGFHIIKSLEKIPAEKAELSKLKDKIKDMMAQDEVQKQLPDYIEKMKKEAKVEVFLDQTK